MKLVKMDRDEHHLVTMTIAVEAQEFEEAVQKAYKKNVGRMNVPGFRRGKAPRKMVEKLYGEGVFYEDAVGEVYPKAFAQAVEESDLEPVERADVSVDEVSAQGFTFTARVHVRPTVTLGTYKGLEASCVVAEVTEQEVDEELQHIQSRHARLIQVERPLQDGDTALFDFEGFVDGAPFEGGEAKGYSLQIGSGRFIPGFEGQMIGMKVEEEKDVNVTFPEEYHAPELAGKEAVFKVKLLEVKETEKPELDDEFAKDASEFDTLEELRGDIRAKKAKEYETQAQDAFERELTRQVTENMTVDIPDAMIQEQQNNMLQDFSYRLSSQGLDMASYLQITGMTSEQMQEQMREQAEQVVKANLAYETVAQLEDITVSEEELEQEYEKIAQSYKISAEQVKSSIDARILKRDLARLKASQFVLEQAVKKQESPSTEGNKKTKETSKAKTVGQKTESSKETTAGKTKENVDEAKAAPKTRKKAVKKEEDTEA